MRKLCTLLVMARLAATATPIQDTTYTGISGSLFNGKVVIGAPDMTTPDGRTIVRWQQEFSITNGIISVSLEPNDTATPSGTSYSVRFTPRSGTSWSERWIVPTSAVALKVHQVRVATVPTPSLMIQPSQILSGGAASGQCLSWLGSSWVPGTCGANAVSSVFGRTGAVSAQAGDYSFTLLAGTASVGQLPSGIPATDIGNGNVGNTAFGYLQNVTSDIQNQLNSKRAKGSSVQADDWCATPGVYDQTCISGAIAQLPSGGVVELSDRTYTFSGKLTVSTERVFIAGMNRVSKILAANGLNDDLVLFNGCNFCGLAGVEFDGNRLNQSAMSYLLNVTNSAMVNIYNNRLYNAHDAAIYWTNSTSFDINNLDRIATIIHVVSNTFELNGAGAIVSDPSSANGANWFITANTFRRNGAGGAMSNNSYVALYGPVYGLYVHFNEESDYTFRSGANAIYLVGLDGSGATPGGSAMWNAQTTAGLFRTTNGASTTYIQQNIPTSYSRSQYYKAVACNGSSPVQLMSTDAPATMVCNNSTGVAEGGILMPVNGSYAISDRSAALNSSTNGHFFYITPVFFLRNTGGQSGTVHIAMTADFSCSGNTLPSIASPAWTNIVTALDIGVNLSVYAENRIFSLNITNVSIGTLAGAGCLNSVNVTGGFMVRVRRVTYSGGATGFNGDLYLLGFIVGEMIPF